MRDVSILLGLCLAVAMILEGGGVVYAQRTLNQGINAVPAPENVVIDGDLSEWDRSGAIICCKDVENLLDAESCKVAAMYDAENLYLSFEFRDSTPMQNKVDPATMAGNGWRSDSIQLRSNMDGFVSHLDAWYFTPGEQPAMSIHYGRFGQNPGQPAVDRPRDPTQLGAKQAFRLAEDGRGYVQEMMIPWAVLTLDGQKPSKDADLRLGLELFWGDVTAEGWPRSRVTDNLMEGHTQTDFFWTNVNAWGKLILRDENNLTLPQPAWMAARRAEPMGQVPITFTLPRDSFVTIAIEDMAGNRVKSLLGGVEFPQGEHTIYWSGLDDRDNLLPAGRYRWHGIYRDAIDINWLMSFYQPNEAIPWNNSDGTGAWGPDHGTLLAAAAGGGRVFLAGSGVEAGFGTFAIDEDGKKLWTVKHAEADALAYADGKLYAYTRYGAVNFIGIAPRGMMHIDAATGEWLDIPTADGKLVKRLPLVGNNETVDGFAADASAVYVSVRDKSVVRSFDRTNFTLKREYPVEGARELFATGNGSVIVSSQKGLLSLNTVNGAVATLVAGDFTGATSIAADADTVYVSFGSAITEIDTQGFLEGQRHQTVSSQHNVQAFKLAEGKVDSVNTIGNRGGRTLNGWYDPQEGFNEPSGLAVDSQGRLWVVEKSYRPKRTSVWKDGIWQRDFIGDTGYGGGGIINPLDPTMAFYDAMRFEIDLDAGTSRLVEVGMVMPEGREEYGIAAGRSDAGSTEYMNALDGRAYVHQCRGTREIYRQREDGRWALCVFIDPQRKLAWIDLNDDCIVQEDEIFRGGPNENWGTTDYWGVRPSQNMDLFFTRGNRGLRLPLQGVTPGGTPIYDFDQFEVMAGEVQNGIGLRDGSFNSGCQGERGEYFSEMRRIYPNDRKQRTFWFRGLNTGRWTYRLPEPGVVLYPFQAHGAVDVPEISSEVVCWVSDFGQRYLFTDDMLYIDQLFMDGRSNFDNWPDRPERGFLANRMTPGQESFHGFFTRTIDGRYILTSGFTDARVFELSGINSLRRLSGETDMLAEHLPRAIEIKEFRETGGQTRGTVTIDRAPNEVVVDATLGEWNRDNAVRINVDRERNAEVFASYNADHLFVAWEVSDSSPMVNNADRWELAFKGGDAVDIMFRLPGENLDDPAIRKGDMRLLITDIQGKPTTVLYRQVSDTKHPYTFDAFEGAGRGNAVSMDEVRHAPEVKTAIRRGETGYIVEAAVPWALIGYTPETGDEFRIDFGVLFGDAAGTTTLVRAYWENRDTQIVADIPSEASLKPSEWGVGYIGK